VRFCTRGVSAVAGSASCSASGLHSCGVRTPCYRAHAEHVTCILPWGTCLPKAGAYWRRSGALALVPVRGGGPACVSCAHSRELHWLREMNDGGEVRPDVRALSHPEGGVSGRFAFGDIVHCGIAACQASCEVVRRACERCVVRPKTPWSMVDGRSQYSQTRLKNRSKRPLPIDYGRRGETQMSKHQKHGHRTGYSCSSKLHLRTE
jgi:hypothetical protein